MQRDHLKTGRSPVPRVVGLGFLIVVAMIYSLFTGSRIYREYVPLEHAAIEIKVEAALGHLWFEEIISGDKEANINSALWHIDQSAHYAKVMLEGDVSPQGVVVALRDPGLRRKIKDVLAKILEFRALAEERWRLSEQSGVESDMDKHFDAVFKDLLEEADEVEVALHAAIEQDLRRFQMVQGLLIAICIGLCALIAFIFRRYERRQKLSIETLRKNEQKLGVRERQQAAVAELGHHALVSVELFSLFDETVAKVARALDMEFCKILELEPGGESAFLIAGVGWKEGLVGCTSVSTGHDSQAGFTLQSKEPVIVKDLRTETRFSGPQLLTDHNVVSGMSVIIGSFENPWGIMGAHTTKQRDFSEDDIYFLQSVVNLLANAIIRKKSDDDKLEIETKIQHTQKLESLGVLAGGIAHDFNNILMTVLGNTDMALQSMTPKSSSYRHLQDIKIASIRASELCRQMLAYSGRGRFVIENIDLQKTIEEMAHMLEISISKKAVLKFDFADNLPPIEADATQIRQLIMNLITNASEAIGDRSGVISISAGAMRCNRTYLRDTFLGESLKEGMYLYIEVADTGCGMDKKTVELMFEPFFTTKFTGRGLGMAAVLGIMRGHKGAIKIYSELGKGTTIKLLFPALDSIKALPKLSEADKSIAKEDSIGRGTVLLVDDEEAILAIVGEMLELFGFKVITASNGREAVEIYKQRKDEISCVLLDLTMPHMDGEEAFRELRQINKNVRVIISSGFNQQEVTQRFLGKGLAGFIEKPYQMKALKKKLKEVLD